MRNGWMVIVPVLLPNLVWLAFPACDVNLSNQTVHRTWWKLLQRAESVTRGAVLATPLFYSMHTSGIVVVLMLLTISVYYAGWSRFFLTGRHQRALFSPLMHIPTPLALMPVLYFLSASVLLRSYLLALASILFGILHVSLSIQQHRLFDGVAPE